MEGLIGEGHVHISGRRVAYAEYGDHRGTPVVACPGNPGSRYGVGWARVFAAQCGIRLIVVERPGVGRSDPWPERDLTGTASDLTAVARSLHLDEFAVLGVSSGGPYALAAAHRSPEVITRASVIAGVGDMRDQNAFDGMSPSNREFWAAAVLSPIGTTHFFEKALSDAADRTDLHEEHRLDIREAGRQGPQLLALDAWVVTWAGSLDLEHIAAPVTFWHGALDDDVPVHQAQGLAARIPSAELNIWPDEGHRYPGDAMPDIYASLRS